MTVYLDIIFCENILMNYIILFATLVIIKIKNKRQKIRLIISSIIGSGEWILKSICHCYFHVRKRMWTGGKLWKKFV